MRNNNLIGNSFQKSLSYMMGSDYSGYDPYDGAWSDYTLINGRKYIRLLSTYINKFSPLNLRPVLKIKKSKQNQALAFIGRAMLSFPDAYLSEINKIADHLTADSLIGKYGFHCWDAHGFPIQMRNGYKPIGCTDVIGTEAIGRFFFELDALKPGQAYREICASVNDFIHNNLRVWNNGLHYFRYTPETKNSKWCYNASIIAAVFVARSSKHYGLDYDESFVDNAVRDVISRQKADGSWYYSLDLESGYEKPQIDFHQGFILDAILEYMELHGFEEPYVSTYKRGLEFYRTKQFFPNGQGVYRYPRKYPVNIHNQAQGIITFTKASAAGFGNLYFDFARTIAGWTIANMQDPDGHFYYLKYPLFTNKIPYIRWSDASMAYALSVYLSNEKSLINHDNSRISRTSGSLSSF